MPGQSEKAFVPKQIIRKKCDGENVPAVSASPRCERQNPNAVPWMQNRNEHEHRPKCPQYSAFPIANKQKRNRDHADNQNRVVMKNSLMQIWHNRLDQPPEKIVQSRKRCDLA